jgi:hypothetical protein
VAHILWGFATMLHNVALAEPAPLVSQLCNLPHSGTLVQSLLQQSLLAAGKGSLSAGVLRNCLSRDRLAPLTVAAGHRAVPSGCQIWHAMALCHVLDLFTLGRWHLGQGAPSFAEDVAAAVPLALVPTLPVAAMVLLQV